MKKLLTLSLVGSFVILTATAQDQIKSYTVEKYDGAQYVKQDSVDYLWTTNQDDERILDGFIFQSYRSISVYEGFDYTPYDERTFFVWEISNNEYFPNSKYIHELNSLGQIKSRTIQAIDSGKLESHTKWEFKYNSSGNIIEEIQYNRRDTGWMATNMLKKIYKNNLLDSSIYFQSSNNGFVQNTFMTYQYSNSILKEKYGKMAETTFSPERNFVKHIFANDSLRHTETELVQRWGINGWYDVDLVTNYYNGNKQKDSMVFESPVGFISQHKTFKYNSFGLSEAIYSNYNRFQQMYYPQVRFSFSYDSKGNLETTIEESIDTSGWKVKTGDLKYYYNYQKRVGLMEQSKSIDFSVYPNPTSDQITISTKGNRINQIRIVDLAGRVVFENQAALNSNEVTIPVRQLNNGTYILTVTSNGQQKSQKILVNH